MRLGVVPKVASSVLPLAAAAPAPAIQSPSGRASRPPHQAARHRVAPTRHRSRRRRSAPIAAALASPRRHPRGRPRSLAPSSLLHRYGRPPTPLSRPSRPPISPHAPPRASLPKRPRASLHVSPRDNPRGSPHGIPRASPRHPLRASPRCAMICVSCSARSGSRHSRLDSWRASTQRCHRWLRQRGMRTQLGGETQGRSPTVWQPARTPPRQPSRRRIH